MAQYLTDGDLTDRLPTLTSTPLETEAERTSKVRTPAKNIVDAWFPSSAPFADVTATPSLVRTGAIEVAVWIALRLLSGDPKDKQAEVALDTAKMLFQVGDDGVAKAQVPGVDTAVRFAVVDVTRSILDEDRDEEDNREALYP